MTITLVSAADERPVKHPRSFLLSSLGWAVRLVNAAARMVRMGRSDVSPGRVCLGRTYRRLW